MSEEVRENSPSVSSPPPSSAASAASAAEGVKRIQIYSSPTSSSSRQVTPFWKEKYERDAKKYWVVFYRRHKDRFFKDRHYLDKEWGHHFQAPEGEKLVVLEVRCGVGNTTFPLISTYPNMFIHVCDFSPRAIDLVKAHKDFSVDKVDAFVCDLTTNNISEMILPSSVDIVTMLQKRCLLYCRISEMLSNQMVVCFFGITPLVTLLRRWIQGVFTTNSLNTKRTDTTLVSLEEHEQKTDHEIHVDKSSSSPANDIEIDVSETIAEMFGISPSYDEINEIKLKGYTFKIKGLAKEYQHTCKSTGLILWDSARLTCNILAENPSIVSGKKVLELRCGSAGICSMVAAHSAEVVVATDGDIEALDLLKQNAISNNSLNFIDNMAMKKLMWGDRNDIEAVKDLSCRDGGFEVIVGTDVTYSPQAIDPLFETAKELISNRVDEKAKPALILCHMQRRVHEDSIISSASKAGFRLVHRWMNGTELNGGVINSWFSDDACSLGSFRTTPLSILYFNCA